MVRPRSFQMGFQPLSEASLRALWLVFLVFLSVAMSLREFTTLSCVLPFVGSDTCLAFVPQFEAQLELLTSSIPRSFLVSCVEPVRLVAPRAVTSMAVSILCEWLLLRRGRFTMRWVLPEPMGFAVAPPASPYTGPGQSPRSWRLSLGAQGGVYSFSLCDFLKVFHGDRSLFYACLSLKCPVGLCCLDTGSDECPDCLRVHSSHFQDSVDSSDWWSRQPVPEASSDRHSVAVALSSSL